MTAVQIRCTMDDTLEICYSIFFTSRVLEVSILSAFYGYPLSNDVTCKCAIGVGQVLLFTVVSS